MASGMSIRTTLAGCALTLAACNSGAQALAQSPSSTGMETDGLDTGDTATGTSVAPDSGTSGDPSTSSGATEASTTHAATTATSGTSSGESTTDESGATSGTSEGATTTAATETSDSTGVASGSTSGAGTSTSATSDGGTSDATTGGDNDVGTDPDPECPLDCDPPCDLVLSEGLEAVTSIQHDGSRFAARDWRGKLVVRDAASLDVVYVEHGTAWAELAAGVLAVAYDDGSVTLRSGDDLAVTGEVVTASQRGLAIDGSYLWALGTEGIDVFAIDGSPVWSTAGDFSLAQVLALPGSLHVFSDAHASDTVMHVDLGADVITETAFEGAFGEWFGDIPRYWSRQGMAYRLYDDDGTELAFGVGNVAHGWGDYVVLNGTVAHVSDVTTPLIEGLSGYPRRSGPALAIYGATSTIVVLDPGGPQQQPFPSPSFAPVDDPAWRFAWSPTGWVVGRSDGVVSDQLDRPTSMGPITRVDAAVGGRFAVTQPNQPTAIWDVVPACTVEVVAALALPDANHELSPDGSVIASEAPSPNFLDNTHGSLLHSLPDGAEIGYFGSSACSHCFILDWTMSDDASTMAHTSNWTGAWFSAAFEVPSGTLIGGDDSNVMPAISPDGAHVMITDSQWGGGSTYEAAVAYVYDDGVFADVFDGVAWGFIDDEHLLLSQYESAGWCWDAGQCDTFLGTDIVTLDGTVVQATTLPDVRGFQRVSDTEIFALDPPRIFDVYSGELLWSMPDVAFAGAISPDMVVWTDSAALVVQRWR